MRPVLLRSTGIALVVVAFVTLAGCACFHESQAAPEYFHVVLVDSATAEDVARMQHDLATNPRVLSVEYVSKEEALAEFKKLMADTPEALEKLEGNSLPASLLVTIRSENDCNAVYAAIEDHPLFDTIVDGADDQGLWIRYH